MRKKALVVDDNQNNLLLENDLLEVAGFQVFTADNATKGIAAAIRELPDIIIMDVRMPDMDGAAAAILLRKEERTRDIPIVFVTASVLSERIDEIRAIPNTGFIGKPINTRTFVEEIAQYVKVGKV